MALDAGASGASADRRRRWSGPVAVALVITTAAVFAVNLVPFRIVGSVDAGITELVAGLGLRLDDSLTVSLVQRLIVYAPLGLLAYAAITLRLGRLAFIGSVLTVAAVGLAVELLQSFLSARHAFSVDFLLVLMVGGLTALAGEIAAGFLARRRRAFLHLVLLGQILTLSAIWLAHRGSDLASWDCGYPLIIGNEATSDRPWLGRIRGVAVYPEALPDGAIGRLAVGFGADGVDRVALGAGLLQTFDGGGGLEIARPALIEATADASGLCEAIRRAAAFTIEIELASLDLDQRGPARILSMSLDPERRNVTLGQDGRRLSLRIRNELNGENGLEQEIRTGEAVSGTWQHWIARYDRGVTTLFLDGEVLEPPLDYEAILLVSGRTSLPLAVLCGVIALVTAAAAVAWLQGRAVGTPGRAAAALMLTLAPPAMMALVIALSSQRLPAASVMLAIGIAGGIGVLVARAVLALDARPDRPIAGR